MIADQIAVMNEDYAPSGLQFVLAGTTRTVNWNWFNDADPSTPTYQTQMKQQVRIITSMTSLHENLLVEFDKLRQGGAADFNVYTVG